MPSNYDNAAWFYDRLSRLVYGNKLIKAQTALLPLVPPDSKILIVGGGTGRIIEEIVKIHASGLNIAYVEVSANMMALSQKRQVLQNQVTYINKPIEEVELSKDFDVVITAFLFDNFLPETFNSVFYQLHKALKTGGLWINTDFQLNYKWWQPLLLKSMYMFFNLLGCMEAKNLISIEPYFQKSNYQIHTKKLFFNEFISTVAYQKLKI